MNARQDWLRARQAGIGGSDVSAILGFSPWKTPLDIYLSKVEPIEASADDGMNDAAYFGTILEDIVAKEFAKRQQQQIQRVNMQLKRPGKEWMIANIDRAIVLPGTRVRVAEDGGTLLGAAGLLEVKTASAYKASDWGRDDDDEAIPVHYAAQAMHYLAVTGLPFCDFATLIGGQKFVTKRVHRDEEVIRTMIERCESFWFENVVARKPPEPINVKDITNLFPGDNGQAIEATTDQLIAYNEAVHLRKQIEDAEAELEKRTDAIKLSIKDHAALATMGKTLITWKQAKGSEKTDWKVVAESLAKLYDDARSQNAISSKQIIASQTKSVAGSRRFLFAKQ